MQVSRAASRRNTGGLGLAIGHVITVRPGGATGGAQQRILQVRGHVCLTDRISGRLLVFQGVLLDRAIDLAQVIDARISLRSDARADEVGNRNRRQQANDGHDDHDLDQRKAGLPGGSIFHTDLVFFDAV